MRRLHLLLAAAVLVAFGALPTAAAEPASTTFSPAPPGTVVQNQLVYLAGEAMHAQWRAVTSKRVVGQSGNQTFYQWYLSIYAIDGATYHLKYQSPKNGGPLASVTKAKGAPLWMPVGSITIVGAAELTQPGLQQLVVQSQQMAADCGSAAVTVFTTVAGKVVPAVSATNGCDLSAAITKTSSGYAVTLRGPYYAPKAAMCCPTIPKATAVLRYHNGKWSESPNYFPLVVGKFPPPF